MPTNPAITAAVAPVADTLVNTAVNRATRCWYAVNARKEANEAEITIYDEIGAYGINAEAFCEELKAITAQTINLRLNTPGGEVFDATAIYNALCEHPADIVVHIDGVAASAGSYIAMSGDEIRMADNAYMMIHNARGGVMGEAEEMRKYAEVLEKMNDNIAGMYAKRAGKSVDHWKGLMDAETWFTAEEAKAEGLVDTVFAAEKKPAKPKAAFDYRIYNKIPDGARTLLGIPAQQNKAPEDSPTLVEPPPAVQTEIPTMADTSAVATQDAPAQSPAAGTSVSQGNPQPQQQAPAPHSTAQLREVTMQGYFEQGKRAGIEEGQLKAMKRLQAIQLACPGKPEMVLSAFLGGQSPESAQLAFAAAAQAEEKAREVATEKDREIARLQALLATGGHAGVPLDFAMEDEPTPGAEETIADPKAHAEREWDFKPGVRRGFRNKETYVAWRVRDLAGTVSVATVQRGE